MRVHVLRLNTVVRTIFYIELVHLYVRVCVLFWNSHKLIIRYTVYRDRVIGDE